MTDDEKREQKTQVLADALQAEEDLDAIAVRAERAGDVLIEIGGILKTDPTQLLAAGWRERVAPLLIKPVASSSNFRDSFFFQSLILLAEDYDTAKKRVTALAEQKRKLRMA